MGPSASQQTRQFDIEINHPHLSKSKIVTENNEKRLQTSFAIDEKQFNKWNLALGKYPSQPSLLLLPVKTNFSRTAVCGHTGHATVQYSNYPYLLTEEIYNKKGKKSRFSQVEMWYLLYCLGKARNQAEQVGEHLGDVRPCNIFLNEEGNIKVSNSLSWPLESTNILKTMDKIITYLAPEDLVQIGKNQYLGAPSEISEAFSIGLTVLSAGNLANYEQLYDLKNMRFNDGRFNEALGYWIGNSSYSEVLKGAVLSLCNRDTSRRMTTSELNILLGKHAVSIEQKTNFVIDNAPQKLHDEIIILRQAFANQAQINQIIPVTSTAPQIEVLAELKAKGANSNAVLPQQQQ